MTQQEIPSSSRGANWLIELINNTRLAWRLFWDPLVPTWLKLIPVGAVAYILLPSDLVPDFFPGLGQIDDLGVLLLSLKLFLSLCPQEAIHRHQVRMSSVEGSYRVIDEEQPEPRVSSCLDTKPHKLLPSLHAEKIGKDNAQDL